MKTAMVLLTCNAGDKFEEVLRSHAFQSYTPDRRIVVDSESEDDTAEKAKKYSWEVVTEKRSSFNHGGTRQKIAAMLLSQGFECVIMGTQDVVLAEKDTLEILLESLRTHGAAAAYARQIPPEEKGMENFFRKRNYPEFSRVKSKEDIPELGLFTAFCSDSLAAWDLQKISAAGGFPETEFGEDMLLAAALILRGEKIVYCAESRCFHGHAHTLGDLFRRGAAIGRMHAQHPELRRNFGSVGKYASKQLRGRDMLRFFLPLSAKYLGMLWGRFR